MCYYDIVVPKGVVCVSTHLNITFLMEPFVLNKSLSRDYRVRLPK